jgi:hypothetical protein
MQILSVVEYQIILSLLLFLFSSQIGDPLDIKMFESTGWVLEESDNKVTKTNSFYLLNCRM